MKTIKTHNYKLAKKKYPKSETEPYNPWDVCTDKVGREDKDKYERCIKGVKKKNKKDNKKASTLNILKTTEAINRKNAQLNLLERKDLEDSLPWIENAILKIDKALKSHDYGFKFHLLKLRRKALLKEYRLIRQLLNR